MNAYMYHMLLRAREAHEDNEVTGVNGIKCPFCVADEDQEWFKHVKLGADENIDIGPRPDRPLAPHCVNCPLRNLAGVPMQQLMDDCVTIGKYMLDKYEGIEDD